MLFRRPSLRARKPVAVTLSLAPLIDIFIVLTLYLLTNFDASGEIICCCTPRLPFAGQTAPLVRAPVVAVGESGEITVEGEIVADVASVRAAPSWRIDRLVERLELQRNAVGLGTPSPDAPLLISAEQAIGFEVLKKVLYSAGVAGYSRLMLAVYKTRDSRR